MRQAVDGAEHIADAVARSHRDAGRQRRHREPGADLAIHTRVEIGGVRLHPRQPLRQQCKALDRLGLGIGMTRGGAEALDAMVDGADAG